MTTGNAESRLACSVRQITRSAVALRDVHKSFGTVQAVGGIDLTIRAGEVMAFLGPNGAGKTSTIDMILGLSRPTAGHVEVYGMPPDGLLPKAWSLRSCKPADCSRTSPWQRRFSTRPSCSLSAVQSPR